MAVSNEAKSNVLFVHYNPKSTGSAVDRTISLVDRLSEKHNIQFFLPGEGVLSELLIERGIEIHNRRLHENENPFSYLYHFLRFGWFILSRKIKLIVLTDFVWWKPAELLAAKLLRVPTVAIIGFYRREAAAHGFLRLIDTIVPNSHSTAKDFLEVGLGEKTKVIHNFIDWQRYQQATSIRRELREGDGALVGYVGVLHPIKGIEYLLQAVPEILAEHPEARFVLAGHEKETGWQKHLESLASELGSSDKIRFLGYRDDIPDIMKSLDVLVVPSLEEPFGFINIEAGAVGTPVIASNIGGIPEIIDHEESGLLIEPKDSKAVAVAVNQLLNDEATRRRYGERLQARVKSYFTKDRALAEWDDVFATLLD